MVVSEVRRRSLPWPAGNLTLQSVQPEPGSEIFLLGYDTPLAWTYDEAAGLTINIPDALQDEANRPSKHAYAFKIKLKTSVS